MYAVVTCLECRRKRIVDLRVEKSACPYCGHRDRNDSMKIYYQSSDLSMARAALNQITGPGLPEIMKKSGKDADPYSTLEYRYEHAHGLDEKMKVLSEGLTEVYGEFTFEDLEKIEPKNAEKMLKAMLTDGCIHETKYGRYTA